MTRSIVGLLVVQPFKLLFPTLHVLILFGFSMHFWYKFCVGFVRIFYAFLVQILCTFVRTAYAFLVQVLRIYDHVATSADNGRTYIFLRVASGKKPVYHTLSRVAVFAIIVHDLLMVGLG